uniref:Uncharacterized protein n=1 Tax=Solanum tuberosum TaxID=4113 RepID=M1DX94_SOLTU
MQDKWRQYMECTSMYIKSAVVQPSGGDVENWYVFDKIEDERFGDDLAEKSDEEELKREEDEKMIALTLTKLLDIEETMVHTALKRSLEDISVVGTSGVF